MNKQTEIQERFIEKMVNHYKFYNTGHANLAMRFGKTRCTIEVLKRLFTSLPKILICYPDNKLKYSWPSEIQKWGYVNSDITLCNFSSIKKLEKEIFDFIIIDEFHSASHNERDICHRIMTNGKNTKTLGLSGTVSQETIDEWGLPEIVKYTTIQGIEDGILADYRITVHLVNLDNKIRTPNKKGVMKTEKQKYDALTWVINKQKEQGKDIMFLALSRNRLSLSSIGKKEYVKKLLNKFSNKRMLVFTGLSEAADDLGIPSYHSKSKNDDNYQMFQRKEINHLALAAMGKVGVTYTELDGVILMNFTYNKEETAQILNRAIMLDYDDKIADLHIISLNEEAEIKKVRESLKMLDETKIKYEKI